MTNAILARWKACVGQTFKPMKQIQILDAQRAKYATAMHHYTPSHRARHQELAWHAATQKATEWLAAQDALDGIAGSSKTAIDSANLKTTLNKSGSVAATNMPFTNGVSQKREFSTTVFQLRSKKYTPTTARVSSDETMKTDTTFATSTSTTQSTSGKPFIAKSTLKAITTARAYSAKAKKTPEQMRLDDEEHRLAEGLVKGDNLMNQDEGMNPNEDKEGMRIHPVDTHHDRHHKKPAPAPGTALGSASIPARSPGESPAGTSACSTPHPGGGVGASRSYATTSTPKAEKPGVKSRLEEANNARLREETKLEDKEASSSNHHHHKNHHKKPPTFTGAAKRRNYSTSTKAKVQQTREHIDEVKDDRLTDRTEINVERYEYTRSGTDNEVGSDPESYCRVHVRPEEELLEEQLNAEKHNHPGHNPLQVSPCNAEVSRPPLNSELSNEARSGKGMKSGPGKTRKGHKVGEKFEKFEEKNVGEPGL